MKSNAGDGKASAIDGLVVSNTTITRPEALQSAGTLVEQAGIVLDLALTIKSKICLITTRLHKYMILPVGGLSGAPLRNLATQQIADVYLRTKGQVSFKAAVMFISVFIDVLLYSCGMSSLELILTCIYLPIRSQSLEWAVLAAVVTLLRRLLLGRRWCKCTHCLHSGNIVFLFS